MTVPFSNLLIQRTAPGKWRFTHKPVEEDPNGKKSGRRSIAFGRFPKYGGGGHIHLIDDKGEQLTKPIQLRASMPGYALHAERTTAGMGWQAATFGFCYKQYAVIYPWWAPPAPVVVDLGRVEEGLENQEPPVVMDYNPAEIRQAFRDRIQKGIQQILCDLDSDKNPTETMRSLSDPYASATTYLHFAGLLGMRELEPSLRKLKLVPKHSKQGNGDIKIAAAVALHRFGMNEEQQFLDAAASGDVVTLRALIPKVDVNWQVQTCVQRANYCDMNGGDTALHLAAKNGHADAVKALLEEAKGIKVDVRGRSSGTPLFMAANKEILLLLLSHAEKTGVNMEGRWGYLHSPGSQGENLLHSFCAAGKLDIVEELLRRGLDINQRGFRGETCLHKACQTGNLELAQLLIQHGAKVDSEARTGKTPFYCAVMGGHKEVVQALFQHSRNLDINIKPKESGAYNAKVMDTALCLVSKKRDLEFVKMLLEYPALETVSVVDALVGATTCRFGDVVELLLGSGRVGVHALILALNKAVKVNSKEMATLLLSHPLADSDCLAPPLALASERGNIEMVSFLLQQPLVDVVVCVVPALEVACAHNRPEVVGLLLKMLGGDVKLWDKSGKALFDAKKKDQTELFQLVLASGADPNYQDKDGWDVLNAAIDAGDLDLVRLLLGFGSDPNLPDKAGWSALHWACENGNTEIVTLLLEGGADGDLKSNKGGTPLDVARSR